MDQTTLGREILRKTHDEPEWFFRDVLGRELVEYQRDIVYSVRDNVKTSVRSCHSIGKTFTAAGIGIWFMHAFAPSVVIDTAPTERQVKNQFWREFRAAHKKAKIPLGGYLYKQQYEIDEDWFALGFAVKEGEDASDKFQGWHGQNILIIVDEASGVHPSVYEAINGVMAGGNARLLLIGNPTNNTGEFAESWRDPGYNCIHVSAFDTPNVQQGQIVVPGLVTPDWVEDMRRRYGEDSDIYRVRVLGEPPKQDSDTMIPLYVVEQAQGADRELYGHDEIIGCDPARYGDDRTAFVRRYGNYAEVLDLISGMDTMSVAGECVRYLRQYEGARMQIDITGGLGAGVYDRLVEIGYGDRVSGVNVAAKAEEREDFENLRDEGWAATGEWLKSAVLAPHAEWVQLAHPKYKITSLGRIKMEAKDDMKKRGVQSPDVGDALVLTHQRPTEGGLGIVYI